MAKIGLTSRDAEKKQTFISFELLLLLVLAVAAFAVVATLGGTAIGRAGNQADAYGAGLDHLADTF
jgi:hypothetical protein